MVETINRFKQVERRFIQDLGREPLLEELAAELDMPPRRCSTSKDFAENSVAETSVGDDDDDSTLEALH